MGWHFSDYNIEQMTLDSMGDARKLNAVGDIVALEKLWYLLDETHYFHNRTDGTHTNAQRYLAKKRDAKKVEFKAACSDQAWTNFEIMVVEAIATWGLSALGKTYQASNLFLKAFKTFDIASGIDSGLSFASDLNNVNPSDALKDKIKTPEQKLLLKKAAETIVARATETFQKEMTAWSIPLNSGIAMYLYFMQKYPLAQLGDVDNRFTLDFIREFAPKIVADANLWNKIKDETPQPSAWQLLFGQTGLYNIEIVTTGFQFALFEVTMIVHNIHGHHDCRGGEINSRLDIVEAKFKTASRIAPLKYH